MKTALICSLLIHLGLLFLLRATQSSEPTVLGRRGEVVLSEVPVKKVHVQPTTKTDGEVSSSSPPASAEASTPSSSTAPAGVSDGSEFGVIVPEYPEESRLRGEEGEVWIRVTLTQEGTIARAELEKTSGYSSLDRAALGAVKRAIRGGEQVGGKNKTLRILFKLR